MIYILNIVLGPYSPKVLTVLEGGLDPATLSFAMLGQLTDSVGIDKLHNTNRLTNKPPDTNGLADFVVTYIFCEMTQIDPSVAVPA